MSGEYLYDQWKENPYCLGCKRELTSTANLRCEKCRKKRELNKENYVKRNYTLNKKNECI